MYKTSRATVVRHPRMAAAQAIARVLRRPIEWAAWAADSLNGEELSAVETAAAAGEKLVVIDLVLQGRLRAASRAGDAAARQRAVCAARIEAAALFKEADVPIPQFEQWECLPRTAGHRPIYPDPPRFVGHGE